MTARLLRNTSRIVEGRKAGKTIPNSLLVVWSRSDNGFGRSAGKEDHMPTGSCQCVCAWCNEARINKYSSHSCMQIPACSLRK